MSTVSVRFSKTEEKILDRLTSHYKEDKTTIIKKSLAELYEDLIDLKEIKEFEKLEAKAEAKFLSHEEVLSSLKS